MLIIAMARWSSRLAAALLRRKAINFETSGSEGVLARVLNTFDLTTLGEWHISISQTVMKRI